MELATGIIYLTTVVIVRLIKILTYAFVVIIAVALVISLAYCIYDRMRGRRKKREKTNQEDTTAKTK